MANWCDNQVVFSGDATALEKVKIFFEEILEKPEQAETHWLPPFVIDIELLDAKVCYCSRWIPNNQALLLLADEFDINFVNHYDELAMGIFGEAKYEQKTYSDIRLDHNDFSSYQYDQETRLYVYDGKNYSFEWPIFEKLLDQKKEGVLNGKSTTEITKRQLFDLYGELLPGDLIIKFAEHKNFEKAREAFNGMDDQVLHEIDNYVSNKPHAKEHYKTEKEFLAFSFLRYLLTERATKQNNERAQENGFNR
jgi:hypothetical protein